MMELNDNTRLKDLSIYLRKEFCIGIYRVGNKNLPPQNTHIFKKADVWVFGHTHHNVDRNIGSTRVVSNQLGKKNDSCAIDLKKIVVIK